MLESSTLPVQRREAVAEASVPGNAAPPISLRPLFLFLLWGDFAFIFFESIFGRFMPLYLKQFDAFLAIGRANAAFYRHAGVPEDRIVTAAYFVDNERFRTQAERPRSMTSRSRRPMTGCDAGRQVKHCANPDK